MMDLKKYAVAALSAAACAYLGSDVDSTVTLAQHCGTCNNYNNNYRPHQQNNQH